MTWERGRKLSTLSGNGVTASYKYDCDGIRTQKTVNGATSKYYYDGIQLLLEEHGNNKLYFYYRSDGIPTAISINGDIYYYKLNSLCEIMGLYNSSGETVCNYEYDVWGNIIAVTDSSGNEITDSSHPAIMNPLRYRGYYYDAETGLYYLINRYYDSETGRFINPDEVSDIGAGIIGYNAFAYVANNPVNNYDPTGNALAATIASITMRTIGRLTSVYTLYKAIEKKISESNYAKNSKNDVKGTIINGQKSEKYNDKEYGVKSMGDTGCGVIAVYNVMTKKGIDVSLAGVTYEMQGYGSMICLGALGTNPLSMKKYFKNHNVDYEACATLESFEDTATDGGLYIIAYWNEEGDITKGAHFVAAQYTNGQYEVYNRYMLSDDSYTFKTVKDIMKQGKYMYGYYIK